MKRNHDSAFLRWQGVVLAIVVIVGSLAGSAYCQIDGVAFLLQQTPPQGGTISPGAGVYNFDLDSEVTLTAVPKPGYQFVYWLGDVSDSTSSSTTVYLDAPKIVIAVFEQAKYEFAVVEERSQSWPGGGARASAPDYARGGGGGGIGRRPPKRRRPQPPRPPEPPEEEPDDFPTPDEEDWDDFPVPGMEDEGDFPIPGDELGDDFPVPEPIPEPATVVLLTVGGLLILVRRRPQRNTSGRRLKDRIF